MIVLNGARCQLDDVSVCCEVSVELMQACELHWIFDEAPLWYFFSLR